MSKSDALYKPLSLPQHFESPDGFVGTFGWLCGYSADAAFLDGAVERFTHETRGQRASRGRVALAAMLDPGNPQIYPIDVPGVIHLPLKASGNRQFKLLHAKLALLGFRHLADPREWLLRLVLSTGNWTRGTVEESLDLVWQVEVSNARVRDADDESSQICADVAAAWAMLDWLRKSFDTRALFAVPAGRQDTETGIAAERLERWLGRARAVGRGVAPRFIDNREEAFLQQVPRLIQSSGNPIARNYFCMGSGFFEAPKEGKAIPAVLKSIVATLREKQLLTAEPEIDIFVNPKACQAVAVSMPALNRLGWNVRQAGNPAYFNPYYRTLHAKFLFSANYRENSEFCNSAWLYLGSGNLTEAGFTQKMGGYAGNLEAGVVLEPQALRWKGNNGVPPEQVVTNVLPLQWDSDFSESTQMLVPGGDMPEREIEYSAGPIAYLIWKLESGNGWLQALDASGEEFDVLDAAGESCSRDAANRFQWTESGQPRQVRIRWIEGKQARYGVVPVLDELGRIAATRLPEIDVEEAWLQLANFPMPPDDDDVPPDDSNGSAEPGGGGTGGQASVGSYPVRQMMQLIENIAAKQTAVAKADWSAWCARLEQSLLQAAASPTLQAFKALGVNPISPLREAPFRPDFALSDAADEGVRYESALSRIEAAWAVRELRDIGKRA